jgi:hypothetical protein
MALRARIGLELSIFLSAGRDAHGGTMGFLAATDDYRRIL